MRDSIKKNRNTNNNGFTLVELIVVITILAILAAILIPVLLGYIDEAKNKEEVLQAKALMNAVQTEMSRCYAKFDPNGTITSNEIFGEQTKPFSDSSDDPDLTTSKFAKKVFSLAGIQDDPKLVMFYTFNYNFENRDPNQSVHDAFTVISLVYWSKTSDKPIFFNIDNNSWEEGNFYTAGIMFRGSNKTMENLYKNVAHKNQILPEHRYALKDVRIYVLYNDYYKNNNKVNSIITLNDEIERAMGLK